jgi:hypothetical protein
VVESVVSTVGTKRHNWTASQQERDRLLVRAELVEILADPRGPDHQERLEWLGLDNATQFDPAVFDVDEVHQALAKLCRTTTAIP